MVSICSREVLSCASGTCTAWSSAQLVGMTTRLSNHIRGVLKTFGLLPGAMRGLPFDRRVETLLSDRDDLASIVRPMLLAWRQRREQIAAFDKEVRTLAKKDPTCR